jgi:hypothetical protein
VVPCGSGNMQAIYLFADGVAAAPTPMKNVLWGYYNSSSGLVDGGSVGFTALGSGADANDFGAVTVDAGAVTTDVHCVLRTGSNTYAHRRNNGTSWSAGQAIPNQNSKAGAGLFMATDGTNAWLFIIDSDAANTVRMCKWTAATPAWDATWTSIEATTKTRNCISGSRQVAGGNIGLLWTETNGGTFDIVGTVYTPPVPSPANLGARPKLGYETPRMQFGGNLSA